MDRREALKAMGALALTACALPPEASPSPLTGVQRTESPAEKTPDPTKTVEQKPEQWKTHTSRLGYEINHPSSWGVGPIGPTEEQFYTNISGQFLKIGYSPMPQGYNLDERVKRDINSLGSQGYRGEAGKIKLPSGVEAWRVSIRIPERRSFGLMEMEAETLMLTINNQVWRLTFERLGVGIDKDMAIMDRVFNSFKVKA